MSLLEPEQAVVVVVAWSLLYATFIGPYLSARRLLAILPRWGADLLMALLDGVNDLTKEERAALAKAVGAVINMAMGGEGDGGSPLRLRPMKWWEYLGFQWGQAKMQERLGGGAKAPPASSTPPSSPPPEAGGEAKRAVLNALLRR